jgi:adenylylsulfate kinase-like enzyme
LASKYDRDEFGTSKTIATEARAPLLGQELIDKFVKYFLFTSWATATGTEPAAKIQTMIIMTGACGNGKSIIARLVTKWLRMSFIEGESLHSKHAISRMTAQTPLTDEDRMSWLGRVAYHAAEAVTDLGFAATSVSCSALRRAYRDVLRDEVRRKGGVRI